MSDDSNQLRAYATHLADGVAGALGPWVQRCVRERATAAGVELSPDDEARLHAAAVAAEQEVGAQVRALLALDVDEQWTNPLQLVRGAVRYPTSVLAAAGVPGVVRDADAERLFPDDTYDLTPAAFADLDPALAEAGVQWGAAKAYVHLARRRQPDP